MEFEKIQYFYLLILVPLLILRCIYLLKWKKIRKNKFADKSLQRNIFSLTDNKYILNNFTLVLIVFFIVLSLVNVLWGTEQIEVKREGVDIVFAIDTSISMNTEDVLPSRLENAKKVVEDLISNLGGDRVGLVIFAGEAYSVMPLTNDYSALKLYLENLDTNLINKQGTNVASAIYEAAKIFPETNDISKAIILLSDGEAHSGNVKEALKLANKRRITIFSVGIGTTKGAPILMENNEYKRDYKGDIVISKLEENSLKNLAGGTYGGYVSDIKPTKASKILQENLLNLDKKEQSLSFSYGSKQYFQYTIGLALLLLIIMTLTNYRNDFNI